LSDATSGRLAKGQSTGTGPCLCRSRPAPCRVFLSIRGQHAFHNTCGMSIRPRSPGIFQTKKSSAPLVPGLLPSRHGSDGAMPRHHLQCYLGTAARRPQAPFVSGDPSLPGLVSLIPGTGPGPRAKHRKLLSVSFSVYSTKKWLANKSAMGLKTSCWCRTAASTSAADQHTVRPPKQLCSPTTASHAGCWLTLCTPGLQHRAHGRQGRWLGANAAQQSEPSVGSGRRTSPFDRQVADTLAVV
jgi:hypothetical protein